MTETSEPTSFGELKETDCYTYQVTMVVQVIAPNKEIAREKLDRDGGYVSKRSVDLLNIVHLYTDEDEEETSE